MTRKILLARLSLLFLLCSTPLFAEVPGGFLLRHQLEVHQLQLRQLDALLADMVESEIDQYYMIPGSGVILTAEKLTTSLTELLKYSSAELSAADREKIAAGRVRNWEHKLTQKGVREEIELIRRAIAGYEEQLRRVGGE